MAKVKICGLKRVEDAKMLNELRPDFAGFIFAPSKRQISLEQALEIRATLDDAIPAVGVFVNEPIENIVAIVESRAIQIVQLHGDEDNTYIEELGKRITLPIIKAVAVKDTADVKKEYAADILLYDTYQSGVAGGTGKTFNWDLLKEATHPFFLAGGLHAGNLEAAIQKVQPYAVDISSGVEKDGVKDFEKIRSVMKIIGRSIK